MLLPLWLHLVCEKPDAIVARGCFSPEGRRQYSAVLRFSILLPTINRHCYEPSLFMWWQQLVLNRKWIYQKRRRRKKPWFNMLHFALCMRDLNGKSARSCSMQLWQAWERTIRSSENISFWGCLLDQIIPAIRDHQHDSSVMRHIKVSLPRHSYSSTPLTGSSTSDSWGVSPY